MLLRKMIAVAIGLALLTGLRTSARADEVVRQQIALDTVFPAVSSNGNVHTSFGPSVGGAALTVSVDHADANPPVKVPLFSLDNPPVRPGAYLLRGQVAYGGVNGAPDLANTAYLEMWSTFADGSSYFSRTLAGAGPMQKFAGHSLRRPFWLAFKPNPGMVLKNVTVNLVFTGAGRVDLFNAVQLVQDDGGAGETASAILPELRDIASQADRLSSDRAAGTRPFSIDEDERRLLEAERRLNESVLPHAWTQRLTVPLEIDVRTSWWFLVGALGLSAAVSAAGRSPGSVGLAIRTVAAVIGVLAFGWGMTALGRGLLAGASLAAAGLILMATALMLLPLLARRRQSAELRRMELLDVG